MTVALHDLHCEARAPQLARRWTAECLHSHLGEGADVPALIADAVLCVSEMVANAVQAGCSHLTLRLQVETQSVRVDVVDDAPGQPAPRDAGPEDHSGRGLRLVAAVSRRWGVEPAAGGKAVWAEFSRLVGDTAF